MDSTASTITMAVRDKVREDIWHQVAEEVEDATWFLQWDDLDENWAPARRASWILVNSGVGVQVLTVF